MNGLWVPRMRRELLCGHAASFAVNGIAEAVIPGLFGPVCGDCFCCGEQYLRQV
jgi:hypothetical protein